MNITTRRRIIALALACVVAITACSSDKKVGNDKLLDFDADQQAALGVTTTTKKGDVTSTTKPVQNTIASTTTTTAKQVTTTVPPSKQTVTIEVTINASSPYFKPGVVEVLIGSKVRFKNTDSVKHSVVADNGSFQSGDIPPGGVWIYTANQKGQFNYSDGGRPFAVGVIDVQ